MEVFCAATRGDLDWVRALVEQDAAVVHALDDNIGMTPLIRAARQGHVEVAWYLLDHDATINHQDHFGFTALHWACWLNRAEVVCLLLQRAADATGVVGEGYAPLVRAARFGHDPVFRALLEHGDNDFDAADPDGHTASHWASRRGRSGMLRQLLEAGADATLRDTQGRTALDGAKEVDQHECITIIQEWERAYLLHRGQRLRERRT